MQPFEDNPDFKRLISSVSFPELAAIVDFARDAGIRDVANFLEFLDYVTVRWYERKSCDCFFD